MTATMANGVHLTVLSQHTGLPAQGLAGQSPAGRGLAGRQELDADLKRSVRHASYMRRGFYVVVLLVALAGQVSGAVEALHIPLIWALPAVGALELGGIVVLANADVRRRLGERAIGSRLLSAAIAVGATAFNWLAHADHLLGGFFAGMSALGYLVWLTHTENQRRDRLRTKGDLPPTTPAYEVVGHWLRHPWVTLRAKSLAKANAQLGLYSSIAAARDAIRTERRTQAIAKVLHRKIRAAVDPSTADIAVAVYDLDEIAERLAAGADYDGLTALVAADLTPSRLAVDATVGVPVETGTAGVLPCGTALALVAGTGEGGTSTALAAGTGTGEGGSGGTASGTGRADRPARRTGSRTALRSPRRTGSAATGQSVARALWDQRVADGEELPGATELARVAGVSVESGIARRWRRAWLDELLPTGTAVPTNADGERAVDGQPDIAQAGGQSAGTTD